MKEKGIDISSHIPKSIKAKELEDIDLVVTMGCGLEACPAPLGKTTIRMKHRRPCR